ncbi:S8 family serine peptidase [Frigidibacter sp. MR17.24]|uniref:S8 family serine peptidase n=1 Tax=Frigidibacter sp. MR17.24 TaxID=3127345 RepID=UPI003012C8DB
MTHSPARPRRGALAALALCAALATLTAAPAARAEPAAAPARGAPLFAPLPEASATARPRALALAPLRDWMSPEVGAAWAQGWTGKGTTVTVIDDFTSTQRLRGNLGTGVRNQRHGEWVRDEARMIAPGASFATQSFYSGRAVVPRGGLNVLNLSYGSPVAASVPFDQIGWSAQERSIRTLADTGRAVVVKSAGNDGVAIGSANRQGRIDALNTYLTGVQGTIFVGALDRNGTPEAQSRLTGYSNFAGADETVQGQFLSVGVESAKTGLAGTSFAAPIVSGYAAIVGQKFKGATAPQIATQLLTTARTDTIAGFDPGLHGRGEASLSRALAPDAIR